MQLSHNTNPTTTTTTTTIDPRLKMDPRFEKPWGDWMLENDAAEKNEYLQMTDETWKVAKRNYIRSTSGDLRHAMDWVDRIEKQRQQAVQPSAAQITADKPDLLFRVWQDMVDEPWKYGDEDWKEWLEMDTELASASGRWRRAAYWLGKQHEEDARAKFQAERTKSEEEFRTRRAMAVVIQAAVRGHLVRNHATFRDCCMCLAHRISPLSTEVGMMCSKCAEQGPYTDILGPVPDPWNWFRADYVTKAPARCAGCLCELDKGSTSRFCDPECADDYVREGWSRTRTRG